jgi:hypothetical protein
MYRRALEQLLTEQGYEDRQLGEKVKALRKDKAAGTGPDWVASVDDDLLDLFKQVADGAVHGGGGDVAALQEYERGLAEAVQKVMEGLLKLVYEEPARRASATASLTAGLRAFKGRPRTA